MTKQRFWTGDIPTKDDFGHPIKSEFIDGRTKFGPWALMSTISWRLNGVGPLGLGRGQRYVKQTDGRWLKVEG